MHQTRYLLATNDTADNVQFPCYWFHAKGSSQALARAAGMLVSRTPSLLGFEFERIPSSDDGADMIYDYGGIAAARSTFCPTTFPSPLATKTHQANSFTTPCSINETADAIKASSADRGCHPNILLAFWFVKAFSFPSSGTITATAPSNHPTILKTRLGSCLVGTFFALSPS